VTLPSGHEAPADLPPPWSEPGDAERSWRRDRMHFPGPLTVLDAEMSHIAGELGVNHGAEHYGLPFRSTVRRFWTRYYDSYEVPDLSDDERDALRSRSRAAYGAVLADYDGHWTSRWLPEIREHLAFWSAFDPSGATDADLLAHLETTMRRLRRIWELHFEIVMTVNAARNLYLELYAELFESDSKLDALALLQGIDNLTMASGRALWRLRDVAIATPSVHDALRRLDCGDVAAALGHLPEAERFRDALASYLEEFGQRSPQLGVSSPTLLEDPAPVVKMLQDALARPQSDLEEQHAAVVSERERLVDRTRAMLRTYPEPVRTEYDRRLALAHTAQRIDEDHNFLIDFGSLAAARRVFLEVGRRCAAAGVLERHDDVVHLTSEEIAETFRRLPDLDRRPLVASRREEMRRYAEVEPPTTVGAPPSPEDAAGNDFFGRPPPPAPSPDVVTGTPGSAGVARGRARVVRSFDGSVRLLPGEVLVAPTTAQPWMTLFSTAAALVTDTGGMLSHTAVVAREYRLPAVVGTVVGTSTIRDGMLLEVDGDRGLVRILEGG
jgi:rifampicin phosphotransferase